MYQTPFDKMDREPVDATAERPAPTLSATPTPDAIWPSSRPHRGLRGTLAERWLFVGLCLVVIAALAMQFAVPIASLTRRISMNNNEGWNAYWSTRVLAGLPLYTDPSSPISNNYPPLSFYIVGLLGRAIGDTILAGRLLCLSALIAVAFMIERVVGWFGGARQWSIAAAGIFLLLIAAVAPRYLAADDPQWLAEALMTGSLLLLIGRMPSMPDDRRIVAACLLMVLSGLIKHNQIALPIATTLWLAWYDRHGLTIWLATAAVAGGIAVAALAFLYGPAVFGEVLRHQRLINPALIGDALHSLGFQLPELLVALALAWRRPRDPRITLLLLFAPLAIAIGIGERMGTGVSQNAHFDSAIALTILAGIALSRGVAGLRQISLRLAAFAVMIAPMTVKAAHHAPANLAQLAAIDRTDAQWRNAIAFLAAQTGPVACERTALCYWSGKPYALDVFNYGQKLHFGHDPIGLRERLAGREFAALVEVRSARDGEDDAHLPADFRKLIAANYRVDRILSDQVYILVPRTS